MVVMKDFKCSVCGSLLEVFVDMGTSESTYRCDECGKERLFHSVCNGGTKSRWRCFDFNVSDPRELSKHISVGKAEAVDCDGKAIEDKNGVPIHDRPQFSQELMDHKIERAITEKERVRGKRPMFFDQK